MSAPADRLIGDLAAERFHVAAAAVLAGPETSPALQDLACAVVLLCRDREARQELQASAIGVRT